jgi:hypothetical protein
MNARCLYILRDSGTLHVFHHQIGNLILSPAVEQLRNVGMMQPCQDLPLAPEPAKYEVGVEARPHHLDGDIRFILLVGPLGKVYTTHTAPADFADQAVGAQPLPFDAGSPQQGDRFGPDGAREGDAQPRFARLVGPQQRLDFGAQFRFSTTHLFKNRTPRRRTQIHDLQKDPLNLVPFVGPRHETPCC